ncbi:MAG TPA: BON domain-containing protein [Anaerolineales bacterium]|nr:BON domain-containing protein [Anaerolineales bacterium]
MNQTMDDLSTRIQNALMNDPRTKEYGVEVFDNNGVITLTGTAPSIDARDAIEAVVRDVEGVTSVVNEIDVNAAWRS